MAHNNDATAAAAMERRAAQEAASQRISHGTSSTRNQDTERLREAILAGSNSHFPSTSRRQPVAPPPQQPPDATVAKLMQARQDAQQKGLRRTAPQSDYPSPYKVSRPRITESDASPTLMGATTPSSETTEPILSFWGPDPVPLPSRFARIKRNIISGHETELEQSWIRLLAAIRADVEQIEELGPHLIPSIEFTDLDEPSQAARFGRDLRRYGVGVVRKVIPHSDIENAVHDTIKYVDEQNQRIPPPNGGKESPMNGSPAMAKNTSTSVGTQSSSYRNVHAQRHDPACFDLFWTPAQVRTRAHPNVRRAQQFMMGLWDTRLDDPLATQLPITYADRLRIYGSGASAPAANFTEQQQPGSKRSIPEQPRKGPQSADDWIGALQSSAGIIAQVDNGSLERWEPDGYQRAGTYDRIFQGRWEEYDPWVSAGRVSANRDLYNGYGACTIFRMFQGVLALSTIEPGMIRLLPSPKLATAYYLLRPFFECKRPAPEWPSSSRTISTQEWDEYLVPENWRLNRNPDTIIHGAVPGHAQRITERWHPHLHLRSSMITLPTLQPGDYILWHPDLPYHLSSGDSSLQGIETPRTPENWFDDMRMLVYIPAAPLTQTNALYLARQRKAFQRGQPGPDFDSSGRNNMIENSANRPEEAEIARVGGQAALRGMGLVPWDEEASNTTYTRATSAATLPNGASPSSVTSVSTAENEVVRLANIILFPDQAIMG